MRLDLAALLAAQGVDVAAWQRTRGVMVARRIGGVWRVRWHATEV